MKTISVALNCLKKNSVRASICAAMALSVTCEIGLAAGLQSPTFPVHRAMPEWKVRETSVNVHINWEMSDKQWRTIMSQLIAARITHIRGAISGDSRCIARIQNLARHGIKLEATAPRPKNKSFTLEGYFNTVAELEKARLTKGTIEFMEGPNEYNSPRVHGVDEQDWAQTLRTYMYDMYKFRAKMQLTHIPIVAPSLARAQDGGDDASKLGNLASVVDFANLHAYNNYGAYPEDESSTRSLSAHIRAAQIVAPGKPMRATEFGYGSGGTGTRGLQVTPHAQAIYDSREIMYMINHGVNPGIYQLVSVGSSIAPPVAIDMGLIDSNLVPKPGFGTLRRLMEVFHAEGSAPGAGQLAYRLEAPADVKTSLFRRADGVFLLVIWRAIEGQGGFETVNLTFPKPVQRITGYRPTLSPDPVWSVANRSELKLTQINGELTVVLLKEQ